MVYGRMYCLICRCTLLLLITITSYAHSDKSILSSRVSTNKQSNTRSYAFERLAVVNLPDLGILRGSVTESAWTKKIIFQFLGVKYAESPTGTKRFKTPVPVKPWQGIRSTTNYGHGCPSFQVVSQMTEEERQQRDLEDCLDMDIYTCELNETAKAPIMVYIHGGGFYTGRSKDHPPNYLMERNIVLIVPNYRLDALGFLSTQSRDIPGNAGLLDVILVLELIQKYAKYFGGDPERVTLFGQSSGAAMISAITISPAVSTKLFQRAIIQSGSVFASWTYAMNPLENARDIVRRTGLTQNLTLPQLNRALIKMDVYQLLKACNDHNSEGMINGINTVGGRSMTYGGPSNLLPDKPDNIRRSGEYRKDLAIMSGATKDDGSYLTSHVYDVLAEMNLLNDKEFMRNDFLSLIARVFAIDDEAGVFTGLATSLYWSQEQVLEGDFREYSTGLTDLLGTIAFKAPILRLIQANARYNPSNTYLYSFDYRGEYSRFGYGEDTSHYPFDGGIHHSNDNLYIFPYPENMAHLNEADTEIAKKMVDLWTSFATNGVPVFNSNNGTNESIEWLPVTNITGPFLHIDTVLHMDNHYIDEYTVGTREAKQLQGS